MATLVKKARLFRLLENRWDFERGDWRGVRLDIEQCKLLNVEVSALSCMWNYRWTVFLQTTVWGHSVRRFKSFLLLEEAVLDIVCFLPCASLSFYGTVNYSELDQPGKCNQLKLFLLNINSYLLCNDTSAWISRKEEVDRGIQWWTWLSGKGKRWDCLFQQTTSVVCTGLTG